MSIPARLKKLRKAIQDKELDAILISSQENRRWLSGFTGSAGYLLITQGAAILGTDFRYTDQAAKQAPQFRVDRITRGTEWFVKQVAELKVKKVGFEGGHMTFDTHAAFLKAIADAPESDRWELVPTSDMVDKLRAVKDKEELKLLTRAIEISDEALVEVSKGLKPGITEAEVAWELEKAMRARGAEGLAFDTIVGAGVNAAMAHHRADETVIQAGVPIVIDMGAKYKGYCADLTRTVIIGEPDEQFRKIYGIVLKAQVEAEERVRTGMTGADTDKIARDIIADAGFGDFFGHSLGHGVGLAVHEYPRVGAKSPDVLEDGMLLTIEPGIYLSEWGGVRIEDVVVMEKGRARVISKAPKISV